ncbi:CPBP family intramembrane glutamic endopeptidase [Rossellomorea sp. BNER]|uniref:CPBP family intramembrane glutamic endopeptidase n=1 Tax=Rossellomorea sp. BNER TaxID=2962031 RepID=UPI003AF2173D|nr:CPBP family intramembrane metalloprotease [Rossellomorea sp. BNER]
MRIQNFSLFWEMIIYGTLVCLICIFPKPRQLYKKSFDFSVLKKFQTYLLILIAFFTIFTANLIIFKRSLSSTLNLLTSSYSQTMLLSDFELVTLVVGILIIGPVFEELLFRVPISIWINRRFYFLAVLLISSILFGIMHSEYPVFGFVLGIVLGGVFKLTKSVVPVMLVHFLWNIFALFYYNYI